MPDAHLGTSEYSRRRFLCWAGTTGIVGIAGCNGIGSTGTPTSTASAPATPSQTAEWWPMYLRDRTNTQHNRKTSGPTDSIGVAWTFETGEKVLSSPAVVNETVYIGSHDGSLYALDMVTGDEKWSFETGGPVRSSPAVVDGTVYVGSNDQRIYALEAESGEKRWEFTTGGPVRSSPTLAKPLQSNIQRLLAIGSDDGSLYLLDAATGDHRREIQTDGAVVSTPALSLASGASRTTASVWYSFGSTNERRYHGQAENGLEYPYANSLPIRGPIHSSVTMQLTERPLEEVEDAFYFELFGTDDGILYKFAGNEEPGWQFETDMKIRSSAALADGVVYVGSWDRHVYAFDRFSGKQQWAFETGGKIESSPAVADGVLYVGSTDKHVYALDTASGEALWEVRTNGEVRSSPAVVNGTVFVGSNDGSVYALTTRE